MSKLVQHVSFFILPLLFFLIPLFFLPTTLNFFYYNKLALIVLAVIILLLTLCLSFLLRLPLNLTFSPLYFPLLLLSLSLILNLTLISEGRPEALVGQATLFGSLIFLTFILTQTHGRDRASFSLVALESSGALLGIYSLLQLVVFPRLSFLPSYLKSQAFSPTGSPLVALTLLIITTATSLTAYLKFSNARRYFSLFTSILSGFGLLAYLSLLFINSGTLITRGLLPYASSWAIALDTLKHFRAVLFGVGLANFAPLFTSVKPLALNATDFWNLAPEASGSEFLGLLTTGGITLLTSFLLMITATLRHLPSQPASPVASSLKVAYFGTLLALLLTPGSIPLYVLFFLLSALLVTGSSAPKTFTLPAPYHLLVATFIFVGSGLLAYSFGKTILADHKLRLSQIALANNNAGAIYTYSLDAVKLRPNLASYRMAYSQINLNLALSLANKKELSDQDRQNVSKLLAQAIREGRAATVLRPNLASSWQNLGNIYRNLINVADKADQFAEQYYAKAVSLDPGNAQLRVDYGSLLFELSRLSKDKDATKSGNYLSQALQQFATAQKLKPDYANASYNLAKVLEGSGNLDGATSALEETLKHLKLDSSDYQTVQTELTNLRAKLPKSSPKPSAQPTTSPIPGGSELSSPAPIASPLPGGPIVLPEESPLPTPVPNP